MVSQPYKHRLCALPSTALTVASARSWTKTTARRATPMTHGFFYPNSVFMFTF